MPSFRISLTSIAPKMVTDLYWIKRKSFFWRLSIKPLRFSQTVGRVFEILRSSPVRQKRFWIILRDSIWDDGGRIRDGFRFHSILLSGDWVFDEFLDDSPSPFYGILRQTWLYSAAQSFCQNLKANLLRLTMTSRCNILETVHKKSCHTAAKNRQLVYSKNRRVLSNDLQPRRSAWHLREFENLKESPIDPSVIV